MAHEGDVASPPQVFTLAEVEQHSDVDDLWTIVHGKVYNLTPFVDEHPGGADMLLEGAGVDCSDIFEDIGHSQEARDMLTKSMARTLDTVLDLVGGTPLIKLQKMSPYPNVEIYVKLEMFNASYSVKDRIVAHIIKGAEESGELKPGGTIVENTSGNTGAAVAMIAAVKGYKAILTMPDKVSMEKQNAMRAYGAQVLVCPTSAPPSSPEHYEHVADRIYKETPNAFKVNQYDNPLNPEAHYQTTGPEIWEQMDGKVTWFVASGSTGGTISGTARYLKEQDPNVRVFMPDVKGSCYYAYWKYNTPPGDEGCTYQVEGIGEDHICKAMDFDLVDDMAQFEDKDIFGLVRRLAKEEGILAGGSSGANLWGCMQLAERYKDSKEVVRIVTVLPDNGVKYLSKVHNDEWMLQHGFLDDEEAEQVRATLAQTPSAPSSSCPLTRACNTVCCAASSVSLFGLGLAAGVLAAKWWQCKKE